MTFQLTEYIKKQIAIAAEEKPDEEVCGVIVNGKIIKLHNLHSDKANHYQIDISKLTTIPDAVYHSHCHDHQSSHFSIDDIESCKSIPEKIPFVLYHTSFKEWDLYDPISPNPFPLTNNKDFKKLDAYIGWRFLWGRSDCFALVKSYFQGILAIDIGDFRRPEFDGFPVPEWLVPWDAIAHGFCEIPRGTSVQKHDIIQIALRGGKQPNHIAVITNAERMEMLHILGFDYPSAIATYGKEWQRRTTKIFRHQQLVDL
ncbi:MAG: hypothetical protein F6K10_18975 [Moorea sp. SIO2B7]|nr:hypothetical protein [Moorena sp. SIO2B7]